MESPYPKHSHVQCSPGPKLRAHPMCLRAKTTIWKILLENGGSAGRCRELRGVLGGILWEMQGFCVFTCSHVVTKNGQGQAPGRTGAAKLQKKRFAIYKSDIGLFLPGSRLSVRPEGVTQLANKDISGSQCIWHVCRLLKLQINS
eukprot:COSAG02_NODE_1040_length_15035_cov_198.613819_7_plen_145_part_00